MSADRQEAVGDQVAGKAKEVIGNVGNAIGIENDMNKEGEKQHEKGNSEYSQAQTKDAANANKNDVTSSLKKNVGGLFSDKQKEEGEKDAAKAEALHKKSEV